MSEILKITIPDTLVGKRLDAALAQILSDYSRAQIQQWLKQGFLTDQDQQALKGKEKTYLGQTVLFNKPEQQDTHWQAEAMPLNIVYEDDDLIVINKPAGLIVHPGAGAPGGTLINGLLAHHPDLAGVPRCGLVHRLDKDTTGLMVVTKTEHAHQQLSHDLQARTVKRHYEAITKGVLISGGTIDVAMGRHPRHRTKMAINPQGRHAVTHYRVIHRYRQHTHIDIALETGRTHQIRVHFEHHNHPLVGDPVYGSHIRPAGKRSEILQSALQSFRRQALHAKSLQLTHPSSQALMTWEAPLPADLRALLDALTDDERTYGPYQP